MQMIFKLSEDNSLSSVLQLNTFGKTLEEKRKRFLSSTNLFTISKLRSKEFAKDLLFDKIIRLMHALFTLKGKVKRSGATL